MTEIITSNGSIHFDNKNIKPLTKCKRCNSKNLEHEFSAGHYSDEYSNSKCLDCNFECGAAMGGWVGWHRENGYEIVFYFGFDNHPVKEWRENFKGARIERTGYKIIGDDDKLNLGNAPFSITLEEALKLIGNKEENWEKMKVSEEINNIADDQFFKAYEKE